MIKELTELNRQLKNRIEHIIEVIEERHESTDYKELECIDIDIGFIMSCQLLDTSDNMARIFIEGEQCWYSPTTKEFKWPIEMIDSWSDEQIISWFKEENERLFPEIIQELIGIER